MIRIIFIGILMLSTSVYAKNLRAKKALSENGYLFVELVSPEKHLSIIRPIETVVTQHAENTTTSGVPIRSWVISTRWVDDKEIRSAALEKVLASNPEWRGYAKSYEPLESTRCYFRLSDPDIKVTQGDRSTVLTSTAELCTYVVHTKNSGDEKLQKAIKNNNLIDSGVAPTVVKMPGNTMIAIDALAISEILKTQGIDTQEEYSERIAGAYLGMAWFQYLRDLDQTQQDEWLAPSSRALVLDALDQTFKHLFVKQDGSMSHYRFTPVSKPTLVTAAEDIVIKFDPQEWR